MAGKLVHIVSFKRENGQPFYFVCEHRFEVSRIHLCIDACLYRDATFGPLRVKTRYDSQTLPRFTSHAKRILVLALVFRFIHTLVRRDSGDSQEGFLPASHLRAINDETMLRMQVMTTRGDCRGSNAQ